VAEINGKEVFLDPGQKMCPVGIIHWKHTVAGGVRGSEKDFVYANTPGATFKQTVRQCFAELLMNSDNSIGGNPRYSMSGQEALRRRQLAIKNDESEVKKQFMESIQNDIPDGSTGRIGSASWFNKGLPVPQWGLDAAKTHTPEYAKDSEAVMLFDEYVETVDTQGRVLEREREAIRILKPQGRDHLCSVSFEQAASMYSAFRWRLISWPR